MSISASAARMRTVASKLRGVRLDRILDEIYDRRLGIRTSGYLEPSVVGHVHYGTISYRGSFAILRAVAHGPEDVLVDVGCGKGRFLYCAAKAGFRRVIGIEYENCLFDIASANVRLMRGFRERVELIHGRAQDFSYRDGTVFYFYNPFDADILRCVIDKIGAERRRPITCIYVNPRHEAVLAATAWLERYDHWQPRNPPSIWCAVSFWRSRA
jgi:SAM-dependent methyltransferase